MTPTTFRRIRKKLDLSQPEMGTILGIKDRVSISRYECGKRAVSGPVSILMRLLDTGAVDVLAMKTLAREIERP